MPGIDLFFFLYSFKIKLEKLNCKEIPFEIQIKRTHRKTFQDSLTFSYLCSLIFCVRFTNWPSSIPTEHWLNNNSELTWCAVRRAVQLQSHLLTHEYLAIKGSSSITLSFETWRDLHRIMDRSKHLFWQQMTIMPWTGIYWHSLIMLFNWWWAQCHPMQSNSSLILDDMEPYYVKCT